MSAALSPRAGGFCLSQRLGTSTFLRSWRESGHIRRGPKPFNEAKSYRVRSVVSQGEGRVGRAVLEAEPRVG